MGPNLFSANVIRLLHRILFLKHAPSHFTSINVILRALTRALIGMKNCIQTTCLVRKDNTRSLTKQCRKCSLDVILHLNVLLSSLVSLICCWSHKHQSYLVLKGCLSTHWEARLGSTTGWSCSLQTFSNGGLWFYHFLNWVSVSVVIGMDIIAYQWHIQYAIGTWYMVTDGIELAIRPVLLVRLIMLSTDPTPLHLSALSTDQCGLRNNG